MRRSRSALALVPALLAGAGCSQFGAYYPVPSSVARDRLLASEAPLMPFGQMATDSVTLQKGDDTIVWAILDDDDHELIRIVAKIAPGAESTRVWSDVAPPQGTRHDAVARGLTENVSSAGLYRAVAAEQVDSALNQRRFDLTRTYGPMMAATLANLPRLSKTFSDDAAASRKQNRDAMQRAYDDEAAGRWPTTQAAGADN